MAKEKLSIIAVFMLLSFSCFSQVRERVNSDTLLHDSLEAENYNHNVNLLEDSVKIIVWKDYGGTASDGSYYPEFGHILHRRRERYIATGQALTQETISKIWRLFFFCNDMG